MLTGERKNFLDDRYESMNLFYIVDKSLLFVPILYTFNDYVTRTFMEQFELPLI
jgi:hypothetical protein